MKLADYMARMAAERGRHPAQRLGQWAFNLLYGMAPELANQIRGTADDPFHDDAKLMKFMTRVAQWDGWDQ